jgi:tetratricopeptide (TPR) repeat protein
VSEEKEFGTAETGDPAAISLALAGASRSEADAYLRDQRHHLHEQLNQIHLDIWEKKLGVLLRLATLCVGLAIAGGLGLMVWDAAHSKGLIITPFNVPPSLRERGLDGEVIASQVIDKLNHMTKSESSRSVQSYANNWGGNIKIEIPETGVSIGELRDFLKDWLGHDIRISGEVYKTEDGIAVTARTGGEEGATFTGKDADLGQLLQQAAEHVYEVTQPYRYANYLDRNHDTKGAEQRVAKATQIYRRLIAGDDPLERAWAWNGLGTIAFVWRDNNRLSASYYRRALEQVPDFTIGYYALSARVQPLVLDREEETLSDLRQAARLLHRPSIPDLNPHYVPNARISADGQLATATGDFAAAIPLFRQGVALDDFSVLSRSNFFIYGMVALSRRHDMGAVRRWMGELHWRQVPPDLLPIRLWVDREAQDWRDLETIEAAGRKGLLLGGDGTASGAATFESDRPYFALAHAELGDFAGAEALIAPTADDNDDAVRVRAQIAELKGSHARADWWFARSERQTPSIPFTDALWAEALLKRGLPDAAIEKFKLSNAKGPHFADPLEGWGEALMAKNQSHLALAKFAEADKYAPNWGRLHLKWGEALAYAGKHDEARAQLARAAALDLTPSEKSELAKVKHV